MSDSSNRAAVEAARENYERWVRSAHTGAHARRTAAQYAAFFLSHLKPGIALLDAGCGPGSITVGLAEAVSPGQVTGIDISASSLELAAKLAAERGITNATFEQHHIRSLPYPEGSFDAVFVHAVLQHIDEPERAVAELFRVMKPGGVIGLADADYDGAITWPDDPLLGRATEIMSRIRPSGDTRIGKRLRSLLAGAGFVNAVGSVAGTAEGDAMTVAMNGGFWANYYAQEPFIAYAEALGLSTREEMNAISEAWKRWGNDPGAFVARFFCHAIGFKPAWPQRHHAGRVA